MKIFLALFASVFCSGVFASTPVERLLLIDDFETWLNSGESLLNWSDIREREVKAFSDTKQPAHVYMDFKKNPFAAEEKYKSIQRIYGHISSIEKGDQGDPIVVFNVGNFDRIYVHGLTKNEVIKLKVPDSINLLCVGFNSVSFGDISATCSKLNDPIKFVAVNNIQLLDKQNKLNVPYKDKDLFNKVLKLLIKEIDPKFNQECSVFDSINYANCIDILNEAMSKIELKKAP